MDNWTLGESKVVVMEYNNFNFDLVISNQRETLSARVVMLDDLHYNRYSVYFNQQVSDIGPSHMLISKRLVDNEYRWICEEMSIMQDEELATGVGAEIDRFFFHCIL